MNIWFNLFLCVRLQSYKPSWKSTHNHFQRYSDVKPREERRSTVVDLANQTHVIQKVNGWKIYHLTSQMEDLVIDNEFNKDIELFFGPFFKHLILIKYLNRSTVGARVTSL